MEKKNEVDIMYNARCGDVDNVSTCFTAVPCLSLVPDVFMNILPPISIWQSVSFPTDPARSFLWLRGVILECEFCLFRSCYERTEMDNVR
jgi:hypothetical protein